MKSHDFKIYCIGLSRDGNKFVTGSADRTAKIWDTNTGQLLFTLQKHDLPVQSVLFSKDDSMVITGGADNVAKVWDTLTGQILFELRN